jgi:hypothetical protein
MLDLSTRFNNAGRKILQDIRDGVDQKIMLDGRPASPNKTSVVERKGFSHRLVGKKNTFTLKGNYKMKKATKSDQSVELTFKNDKMAKIALYNQTPTGNGAIAKEDAMLFWGISERVMNEIDKEDDAYISNAVDIEFKRTGFKQIS